MKAEDVPTITGDRFCAEYARQVYRFASMVSRSDPDAEDLAQEALLRALRNLRHFDPGRGSMSAWLWRITVNAARDAGRVAQRRQAVWERMVRSQAPEESVESRALDRVRDSELLTAVRALPKRDRALIALRFGAGLDYASVGAALGLTPGAASVATRRALGTLRHRLEGTAR